MKDEMKEKIASSTDAELFFKLRSLREIEEEIIKELSQRTLLEEDKKQFMKGL